MYQITQRNIIDVSISCSHLHRQVLKVQFLDLAFKISTCPEISIMYDIIGNTLMNAMYARISLNNNSH